MNQGILFTILMAVLSISALLFRTIAVMLAVPFLLVIVACRGLLLNNQDSQDEVEGQKSEAQTKYSSIATLLVDNTTKNWCCELADGDKAEYLSSKISRCSLPTDSTPTYRANCLP